MITLTAVKVRANLYRLLDKAAKNHEPIQITGKKKLHPCFRRGLARHTRDAFLSFHSRHAKIDPKRPGSSRFGT